MDKIDLDAIMHKEMAKHMHMELWMNEEEFNLIKGFMKEAAHQALVLASKHVRMDYTGLGHFDTPTEISKQSILDVEKLIV